MNKTEFKSAINHDLIEKYQTSGVDKYFEYAYKMYKKKVVPYRTLITSWRNRESGERPTLNEIRIALDLPRTLFEIYKDLPEFVEITDLNRDIMGLKAQKDLVQAVGITLEDRKPNAKLLETQLIRFDKGYNKEKDKDDNSLPRTVNVNFTNGSLSDEEIAKKSGSKDVGE